MKIEQKYIVKYFHRIATDQIADKYSAKGYSIKKEARIGKFYADILAEKDDEKIVIEIKTHKLRNEQKKHLAEIADYINSLGGYQFIVAIALPPTQKNIEISGIEYLLTEEFNLNIPDELDHLSTHTHVSSVEDVVINNIIIRDNNINCEGYGIINAKLQYGSDGDQQRGDGYETRDSFSFEFNICLTYTKNKLSIDSLNKLDIDTSEF